MNDMKTCDAIARDLAKIDLIMAIGNRAAKKLATEHREACFRELKRMNISDGLDLMTDEEVLAGLFP